MGDGQVGARLLALYTEIDTEATTALTNSNTNDSAYRSSRRPT